MRFGPEEKRIACLRITYFVERCVMFVATVSILIAATCVCKQRAHRMTVISTDQLQTARMSSQKIMCCREPTAAGARAACLYATRVDVS